MTYASRTKVIHNLRLIGQTPFLSLKKSEQGVNGNNNVDFEHVFEDKSRYIARFTSIACEYQRRLRQRLLHHHPAQYTLAKVVGAAEYSSLVQE